MGIVLAREAARRAGASAGTVAAGFGLVVVITQAQVNRPLIVERQRIKHVSRTGFGIGVGKCRAVGDRTRPVVVR
ncbi:hypothetical protein D9M71_519710 [compost metagenome]